MKHTLIVKETKETQWPLINAGMEKYHSRTSVMEVSTWTVEFVLKGRRVIPPVPEARTQAQAEQAKSQLKAGDVRVFPQ